MLTHSVQPETIEEVQSEIERWLSGENKNAIHWFSFETIPHRPTLRVFISHSRSDSNFKVDLKPEERHIFFAFSFEQHRLDLNLAKFLVGMSVDDQRTCLYIHRDPTPEHHFLISMLRQFSDTKYPVFYTRLLRAMHGLEKDLSASRINEASAAPTDELVALEVLAALSQMAAKDDPIAAAKLRGLRRKHEMLQAAGGVWSSEQVAEILHLTRQAVDKRRSSNQLLALTQGRRGYSYPAFQFEDGNTLAGLEEVLHALSAVDPWMQLNFFISPDERLGEKTPIEALREGKEQVNAVVKVASTYGEQGAL